jgi:hypothetical protein
MAEEPEKVDYRYILANPDQHYLSADHKWMIWTRRNIVILRPSGQWSAEDTAYHVKQYWDFFMNLRKTWPKVYYVIDMNSMEIQNEEFRYYLKENWAHVLDREDLGLCFVESKAMKRLIWSSIFQLLGKQDRLFLFKDFAEAFAWIRGERVKNGACKAMAEKIGEFLIRTGAMTSGQVKTILQVQQAGDKRRFGEIALALGYVNDDAIKRYVDYLEKTEAG